MDSDFHHGVLLPLSVSDFDLFPNLFILLTYSIAKKIWKINK